MLYYSSTLWSFSRGDIRHRARGEADMKRPKIRSIATDAFFDNFSFAALFGKIRIPASPRSIMDPRSLREFASDELDLGMKDMLEEVARIQAIVLALSIRGSLISKESLQGLLDQWSESSLKPLENLHQSQ
jgi:hypothetical protein